MAGKKSVRVKAHNRRPPTKKADEGYGLGVWLVGAAVVAYAVWTFRGSLLGAARH